MNSRMAIHRPKGPSSLSPAQRAGYSCRQIMRPEGPRYAVAVWVAAGYRAPLGRTNVSVAGCPGRCPGLRDDAPLALKALGQLEADIQQGMKELEDMLK